MDQFDDNLARQTAERDALKRQEAEALISQDREVSAAVPQTGASRGDTLLIVGVVIVVLICIVALKLNPAPSGKPATPGPVIAQQQPPAPPIPATYIAWDTNLDASVQRARTENKRVMVEFYTQWCGFCKKVDAEVYTNAQVIGEAQNFVNVKIDAEKYTVLAAKYGVKRYPTFLFLDVNGNEIGRQNGAPDVNEMLNMLNHYKRE